MLVTETLLWRVRHRITKIDTAGQDPLLFFRQIHDATCRSLRIRQRYQNCGRAQAALLKSSGSKSRIALRVTRPKRRRQVALTG